MKHIIVYLIASAACVVLGVQLASSQVQSVPRFAPIQDDLLIDGGRYQVKNPPRSVVEAVVIAAAQVGASIIAAEVGVSPQAASYAVGRGFAKIIPNQDSGTVVVENNTPGYQFCKIAHTVESHTPPKGDYRPRFGISDIEENRVELAYWLPKQPEFRGNTVLTGSLYLVLIRDNLYESNVQSGFCKPMTFGKRNPGF